MDKIILPQGYKPSEDEEYMNPLQLEYFRQKLIKWRNELLAESRDTLEHLREENWNEPDLTDRASVETETSIELRTRDRYRKLIDKIEGAIERINKGEYGYCDETGEQIGLRRLEARPVATLSIEAQTRLEQYEKTHLDEDKAEV
ncbi:MAG: RNA polymerase-binding protein DksA [Rickettsiales bacterium]|nr:RNA polymerase-binding protein DksA [Rickettsiales bacterium]MCA0254697.1 RNA polymerase-binding protein DksA [Pseudomonadota bacterium]